MNETNALMWLPAVVPGAAALLCLTAAGALAGLVRLNRGASINRAWGLLAFAALCFGLAGADRTLDLLGLPNAMAARDALMALGSLCALVGAVLARKIYRALAE